MMLSRPLSVLITAAMFMLGWCSSLQIRNNGYENLVVAISEDIPEDRTMIDELKSMFTEASAFMHIATRRRAFMRNITILLPSTWTDSPDYKRIGRETFEKADVRIDPRINPQHGNGPYTWQVNGCGKPGQYIHLTPDYVLDFGTDRETNWGPVGKVLVHEFAHLRYGVFDEYVDQTGQGGNTEGCSKETVKKCEESSDEVIRRECASSSSRPKASIMYKQFLGSIDSFCESDSEDPFLEHNENSNNDQNRNCNNRGTWDVISSHPDFANGNSPPVGIPDTSPMFTVVYPRPLNNQDGGAICRRLVLVMDISGSMAGERIFRLGQFGARLISDISPIGTELGMVVFESTARIWNSMTLARNDSAKDDLADLLPTGNDVGGSTAIGQGVLKGIELLQQDGMSSDGSIIFLISDGGENVVPLIKDILDNVTASGVIVYTVALSQSAAAQALNNISVVSGGLYYYDADISTSTAFDGALTARLADELRCLTTPRRATVELTRRTAKLTEEITWTSDTVLVDPSIGNQTLFSFSYPEGTEIKVTLTGPSGQYDMNSPEYSQDDQFNIIRFRIPDAKPGLWTYNITNTGRIFRDQVTVVTAISYPRQGVEPITVKAYMSQIEVSFGQRTAIYAELTKGYLPVVKAEVVATVDRSTGGPVNVTLLDNGQGADIKKDDGVYSAFFTEISGNGKYSVDVVVSTNEETSVVTAGSGTGGSARSTTGTPPPTVLEKVDPFLRITSAGGFLVTDFVPNTDPYPPSRITDLKAEEYSFLDATVTLTWTAPGGDLDQGNASHYELRRADTFAELRLSFNESFLINISLVDPLPAGSRERVVIQLPYNISAEEKHIFGILAFDDALNSGAVSNLVVVEKMQPTTVTAEPTLRTTIGRGVKMAPIITDVIGCVFIVYSFVHLYM